MRVNTHTPSVCTERANIDMQINCNCSKHVRGCDTHTHTHCWEVVILFKCQLIENRLQYSCCSKAIWFTISKFWNCSSHTIFFHEVLELQTQTCTLTHSRYKLIKPPRFVLFKCEHSLREAQQTVILFAERIYILYSIFYAIYNLSLPSFFSLRGNHVRNRIDTQIYKFKFKLIFRICVCRHTVALCVCACSLHFH